MMSHVGILAMALVDIVSTRMFLRDMTAAQRIKRAEMEAEIKRLRDEQRTGEENGKQVK